MRCHASHSPQRRRGFSMVESLTAVTITTVAGAALLASLGAAVQSSTDAAHQAVARGLARQLMDEIAAAPFPTGAPFPRTAGTRETFVDLDDYDRWQARPPVDRRGRPVGSEGYEFGGVEVPRSGSMQADPHLLARLTREVQVERVRPDGAGGWQTVAEHTDFRRVTVRVTRTDPHGSVRPLAELSQVFSRTPAGP